MPIIKQLDEHVANLIAAGEVIERAASVVKELVENSIDAHSTNISVHLIDSGVTEIRVIDNGDGMDQYDAKMCILPHATSKINNSNDLFSIRTLGFRGEALSSIVAVSQFRLISSVDGYKGIMYSLKGGVPMSEAIVAHDKGTEIIVKNLFFNTPARLQNLQSQNTELSYISDLMSKMALSYPNISFTLTNNERVILKTNGNGDLLEVISSIISLDAAKNMIKIFDTNGTYRIDGYISNISLTKASKNYMYIFVNGRIIKSHNVNNAILKGYDTLLMNGKFPVVVLNIEADASIVDVNVHPTKAEVRFSDEESLLSLITDAISKTLNKQDLTINMSFNNDEEENDSFYSLKEDENNFYEDEEEDYEEEESDLFINSFEKDDGNDLEFIPEQKQVVNEPEYKETYIQQQYNLFDDEITDEGTVNINKIGKLNYIGQLFGTYLIAQTENDLVLIDQHAAAERINYEKILLELNKEENVGYDLLVPFNLEFSSSEAMLVKENYEKINSLGIGLEEFGLTTFIVRRIPIWIFRGKEKEFIEEIITQVIQGRKSTKVEFLNGLAKSLACKKSIKGNEFHSNIEIEYLLEDLRNTTNPFTCPHGRPIIIKFDKYEIEKWFKRIV